MKYAFPTPRAGTIEVQVQRGQAGWVEVLVRDNGIGMSNLREGSLGYGLVRALIEQIGGEIRVQNRDGLAVTILFPDRQPTHRRSAHESGEAAS